MLSAGDSDVHGTDLGLSRIQDHLRHVRHVSGAGRTLPAGGHRALQDLYAAGEKNGQVEFLDETYYHSLTSLFEDPHKTEFREQVSLHREKMRRLFGIFPTSYRNTELMYNNHIADVVADMGYQSILCEKRDDMFTKEEAAISPNAVFRARNTNLIVIPRNRELSDDIAFRFPHTPLRRSSTPDTSP